MTKANIISGISQKTGIEKVVVKAAVEAFMNEIKDTMAKNNNVYLRGFGSFVVKKRATKTARNISRNTTVMIPAHNIPSFKPADSFSDMIKENVPVK